MQSKLTTDGKMYKLMVLLVLIGVSNCQQQYDTSAECLSCISQVALITQQPQDCNVPGGPCGPYALYSSETDLVCGEDFQTCAPDAACSSACAANVISNLFADATCATNLGVQADAVTCHDTAVGYLLRDSFCVDVDMSTAFYRTLLLSFCPELSTIPEEEIIADYPDTECEKSGGAGGTCQRNDNECQGGQYQDGLCSLTPSGTGGVRSSPYYHSCCIPGYTAGYTVYTPTL